LNNSAKWRYINQNIASASGGYMQITKQVVFVIAASLGMFLISSCEFPEAEWVDIKGRVVVQGPLVNPTVDIFQLGEDGEIGQLLESRNTTSYYGVSGGDFYYINYSELGSPKCLLLEASEGSYFDRVQNQNVSVSAPQKLRAIVCDATIKRIGETDMVAITPLSTMVAKRALTLASLGTPLKSAVETSAGGVAQQYGLASVQNILPVDPADPEAVAGTIRAGRQYSLVLGGLAKLAADSNVSAIELALSLAQDAADGTLNGGMTQLQQAIDSFSASASYNATNLAGHVITPTAVPIGAGSGELRIVDTALPAWVSGQSGSYRLTQRGGQEPCSWSGSLPSGFTLEGDTITGAGTLNPGSTMSISAPFTITVACQDQSHSVQFTLTIVEQPPTLTTYPVTIEQNKPMEPQLLVEASGGTGPYRYSLDTGSRLPHGLVLDRYTGMLSGTPRERGTFRALRICAIDLVGSATCDTLPPLLVSQGEDNNQGGQCSPACSGTAICVSSRSCIKSSFDNSCECAGSTTGTCADFVAYGINVTECGTCGVDYTACCPGTICVNGTCQDSCP
jgi:hypothetical protein